MIVCVGVAGAPRAVMMPDRLSAYATARRTFTSFQGATDVFILKNPSEQLGAVMRVPPEVDATGRAFTTGTWTSISPARRARAALVSSGMKLTEMRWMLTRPRQY